MGFELDIHPEPEIDVGNGGPEIRVSTIEDFSRAIEAIKNVLIANEPKHQGRWRNESVFSHVAHCRAHCETWIEGRSLEDLAHGATRALMALEMALREADRPEPGA